MLYLSCPHTNKIEELTSKSIYSLIGNNNSETVSNPLPVLHNILPMALVVTFK